MSDGRGYVLHAVVPPIAFSKRVSSRPSRKACGGFWEPRLSQVRIMLAVCRLGEYEWMGAIYPLVEQEDQQKLRAQCCHVNCVEGANATDEIGFAAIPKFE